MGIAFLFILGLCAGSFVNALVWRLSTSKNWINDRSECINCHHKLSAKDLVPVFSWLSLQGKCRYCSEPISRQYPIIELLGGLWFVTSLIYWPTALSTVSEVSLFVAWLISSVGLIALIIYDHKWMILPTKIIYSALVFAAIARIINVVQSPYPLNDLKNWGLSILVASGLFFVLHEISKGRWIGFGDVRLGLLTGTLLGTPEKSLEMIFIASILGSVFAIPSAISKKKVLSQRFAYGPFLIFSTGFVMLFGQKVIDWYLSFF